MKIIFNALKSVKRYLFLQMKKIELFNYFWYDYKYYISTNFLTAPKQKDTLAARIMLIVHQLEKGMSMTSNPRIFGGCKSVTLVALLREYEKDNDYDEVYVLATNVLYEYSKNQWSTRDELERATIINFLEKHRNIINEGYAGTKKVSEPPVFNDSLIKEFFETRFSVRDFSKIPVSEDEITKAIEFAQVTPSACNRQTSRVHYYNDPAVVRAIIDNQLGDQGWCQNATGIVVITSNQSYFGHAYERYESLIDGGLYAMNLVYGLHLQHIATCFKMYVREPRRDILFKQITNIPHNEIPVVTILTGHYKDKHVTEPKSVRIGQN